MHRWRIVVLIVDNWMRASGNGEKIRSFFCCLSDVRDSKLSGVPSLSIGRFWWKIIIWIPSQCVALNATCGIVELESLELAYFRN